MNIIEFGKYDRLQDIFDACNNDIDEFFLVNALESEKNEDILKRGTHYMLVMKDLEPIVFILGDNLFIKLI